jgi:hypothetical protein
VVPVFRTVANHVEMVLNTLTRGKSHTSPSHHNDIAVLSKQYAKNSIHKKEPGRKVKLEEDTVEDYNQKGVQQLIYNDDKVKLWWEKRAGAYERATTQIWDDESESEGEGEGGLLVTKLDAPLSQSDIDDTGSTSRDSTPDLDWITIHPLEMDRDVDEREEIEGHRGDHSGGSAHQGSLIFEDMDMINMEEERFWRMD